MQIVLKYKCKVIVGLIIIFALLFFFTGANIYRKNLPVVVLKVEDALIRQDETVPEFKVYAEYEGSKEVVLDRKTGYTAKDFVDELNRGSGYQLNYNVDNTKEGSYELKLDFEKEWKTKLDSLWSYKIRYRIENGVLTVLNKYGDWEDGKFKMLDGTYAAGWTNLGPDTYYFGEDGKRVLGEQKISGNTYYFKEDGKFDTEKNRVNPNRPMIALTFDDGPGPQTMQILEQLEAYNARATFFMVGRNIAKYPDTIQKMSEIGCDLGNHTMNHSRLSKFPTEVIKSEIQTANAQIQDIIGRGATLVRPPFGAINETVQSVADAPLIMWSVDTKDWDIQNKELVRDFVLTCVKDGDIVLMHDVYETTIQAAVELIPQLIEQGYQLVTVNELARARGITLENGMKYYCFR